MTNSPLSGEMLDIHVNQITHTRKISRIFIKRSFGGHSSSDIMIETSPVGFLVWKVYRGMAVCARRRALPMDVHLERISEASNPA